MKRVVAGIVLLTALMVGGIARAEIGTIDEVPAATLLVPYFEVDLNDPNGITTLFSVNNASATAVLAHVTFWTDESIPTLDFNIYLTGYDVQTVNVRDVFNGFLPITASAGQDPANTISPKGSLSQDINFASCTGLLPYGSPALKAVLIDHLRKSHTGLSSALYGGCSGANYGDNVARGYITVDTVNYCTLQFPGDAGYFTSTATNQNVLWGDVFYVNPAQNFASGNAAVHIEACSNSVFPYLGYVGNGAGLCPFSFAAGDYTFYGRYNALAGQDQREPLATTFASRYINGGGFSGGTDLIVWRDSKTVPTGPNGTHLCSANPAWFPLNQTDVVSFDETENPTDLCFQGDNISPPTGGTETCFPLETQRVHLAGGNTIGGDPAPPAPFGWIYLNLNHSLASGDPYPGRAQAWVMTEMSASGRYEVGYDAIQLDNATRSVPGGVILIGGGT